MDSWQSITAPKVGDDVRLECVAFGYPVPKYNWTRKGAPLPKGSIVTNFNRILILPKVKVQDMGDYVCRATNDRVRFFFQPPFDLGLHLCCFLPLDSHRSYFPSSDFRDFYP